MVEKRSITTVGKILYLQSAVVVVASLIFYAIGASDMAVSSLLGGMIAFLPNLYFSYKITSVKEQSAKNIVRAFYSGESRKMLMTFLLFALAFQVPGIQFFPLMVCFVAVLSVFWLALILFAQEFEIKSVREDG